MSQPNYGWDPFFTLIKNFGFSPKMVIDVGANRGNWTRVALRHFPQAQFVLVEPQDGLKAHIRDLFDAGAAIKWINAGVADQPGKLPLTLAPRDDSSTFVLSPAEASAAGYAQTEVEIVTLNEIVSKNGGVVPEMVKIDAEGFDLRAFAGASNLHGKTDIFFVEAAVCATGIPNTMAAVVAAMDRAGYRMIDITDINRSPRQGVLWLCELAFMRGDCPLLKQISSYE